MTYVICIGCAIKNNILKLWRDHFILEEDMLEIATTCITPYPVFKASVIINLFHSFKGKIR